MNEPDEKQWTFWDALLNRNPAWNEPEDEDEEEEEESDE